MATNRCTMNTGLLSTIHPQLLGCAHGTGFKHLSRPSTRPLHQGDWYDFTSNDNTGGLFTPEVNGPAGLMGGNHVDAHAESCMEVNYIKSEDWCDRYVLTDLLLPSNLVTDFQASALFFRDPGVAPSYPTVT